MWAQRSVLDSDFDRFMNAADRYLVACVDDQ